MEKNIQFKLYTEPSNNPKIHKISFTALKDEVAEILGVSDKSPNDLQDESDGPLINDAYKM